MMKQAQNTLIVAREQFKSAGQMATKSATLISLIAASSSAGCAQGFALSDATHPGFTKIMRDIHELALQIQTAALDLLPRD